MENLGQRGMSEYAQYRNAKMASGAKFQDFIMERMHSIGVILQPYCSQQGQLKGENLLGMEIKNDEKMATSGNLYIEVAEKAQPRPGDYAESGIFRSDNTWLYGIGDRGVFYVFAKSTLRNAWAKREAMNFREVATPTSKGFLIPRTNAERMCARCILFDAFGNIREVRCGGEASIIDLSSLELKHDAQMSLFK
jgi:hypothetical protein